MSNQHVRLLIDCPDKTGLVAAVAGFIGDHAGNILDADQHTDADEGRFFMRVAFDASKMDMDEQGFRTHWDPIARAHAMRYTLSWNRGPKRVIVLASRETHCLSDLLWRWSNEELDGHIVGVVSNHETGRRMTESFGAPFHHEPLTSGTKDEQERRLNALIEETGTELIVLARYMQILSPAFVAAHAERIINVHHSFLPAFAGARPYHQAYARGVKIIGATSHYVTEELDQGPIIAQMTTPVSHRDSVGDLVRKGRDLERVVLAEAVRLHLEDKILTCGNKTVVFE